MLDIDAIRRSCETEMPYGSPLGLWFSSKLGLALCDEVERLRAEVKQLVALLQRAAGSVSWEAAAPSDWMAPGQAREADELLAEIRQAIQDQ